MPELSEHQSVHNATWTPRAVGLPVVLGLRKALRHAHIVSFGLCVFVASFFLIEKLHIHRLIYYVFVLLPFAAAFNPRLAARVVRSPVWWLAVGHALFLWVSVGWSGQADWPALQRFGWQLICLVTFLTILPSALLDEPRLEAWLCRSLAAAAVVAGLYSIAVQFGESWGGRLSPIGLPSHPIIAGAAYGIAAVAAAARVVRSDVAVWERILFSVLLAGLVSVVALTQSRGPLLGLAVTLILMLAVLRGRAALLLALAGLGVFAALEAAGLVHFSSFLARADSHRFELWNLYLDRIAERPFLGFGVNADVEVLLEQGTVITHPHNLILASQIHGGILAALLLIGLLGAAFAAAYRSFKAGESGLALWLLAFIVVTGSFDFGHMLANAGYEWLCFWLPVGWAIAADARRRRRLSPA
jgi:O-antigen ligase